MKNIADTDPNELERIAESSEVKLGHDVAGEHVLMAVLTDSGKAIVAILRPDEAEDVVNQIQSELRIIRKIRSTHTN